jgi:ABC-type multidrug transport system fused ATPase/permease subunit
MEEQLKQSVKRGIHKVSTALLLVGLVGVFGVAYKVHSHPAPKIDIHHPAGKAESAHPSNAPAAPSTTPASATPAETQAKPDAANEDHWGNGDVISALTGFYQTIITVLVALLGLVGLLSVVTLRFLSHATAEETAHAAAKKAMEHVLTSKDFYDKLDEAVQQSEISKQLENLSKQLEGIETEKVEILKRLERLQERMIMLESTDRHASSDEESEGGTIMNPDGPR